MPGASVNLQPSSAPKNSHACAGCGVIMLNQQNSPGLRTPVATDDETTFLKAFSISMSSPFTCTLPKTIGMPEDESADRQPTPGWAFFACRLRRYSFVLRKGFPCSTLSFV